MEYSADIMASKTTAKSNGKKDSKRKGKREFAGSAGTDRVKKKPGRKASKFTKTGRRRQRRDPDAPKRARTAFNFFLMEFRQKYLVSLPPANACRLRDTCDAAGY